MLTVGPYVLVEEIGSGAMGRVYSARDQRTQERVAVKALLPGARPDDLYSLKREFRLAGGLASAHLVPVYDLFVVEDTAYLVMPLLRGQTLELWAQHAAWREDPLQLYGVLKGALFGLADLHGSGLVHRDVKPRNVMVEPDGRVLLLDYGLLTQQAREEAFLAASATGITGTIAYLPPEALQGVAPSPAQDLFSLGVSGFEIITGRLPPRRNFEWVIPSAEMQGVLRAVDPPLPEPLVELFSALLDERPDARGSIPSAIRVLDGLSGGSVHSVRTIPTAASAIVGRADELDALVAALRVPRARIAVFGPSGIGKTMLAQSALARLKRDAPERLVITGRCHPGEHGRYRVLDAAIDEIYRWMLRCAASTIRELLPHDFAILGNAFPILRRLDPNAAQDSIPLDPDERRRRLVLAMAALFANLDRQWPLTLWIDDVHWADVDGARLFSEVVERLGDAGPSILLTGRELPENLVGHFEHAVRLAPLSEADSRELLARRSNAEPMGNAVEGLLAAARGNPGLLCHLVDQLDNAGEERVSLPELIARRLTRLDSSARTLVEDLSLLGQPLPLSAVHVLLHAGEPRRTIHELESVGLVRRVMFRGHGGIEIVHDALREAIVERMDTASTRDAHRDLALALEATPETPREVVGEHWERAGSTGRACGLFLDAARNAIGALAFTHAVSCFERAIATSSPEHRHALLPELANALALAGETHRSARTFDECARTLPSGMNDHVRRAAIQFLLAGDVDAGLERVVALFRELQVNIPRGSLSALIRLAFGRIFRRRRRITYRLDGRADPRHSGLADLAFATSTCLAQIDLALGAYVQSLHLAHGLECGDPLRVSRALAVEAGFLATTGGNEGKTRDLLQQAKTVLGSRDFPQMRALFEIVEAGVAWSTGQWKRCAEHAAEGSRIAQEDCTGAWWELGFSRSMHQDALRWMGDYRELRARTHAYLNDAERRGDNYGSVTYTTRFVTTIELVDDRLEHAWASCAAVKRWTARGVHLQHLTELHARAECLLYSGDPRAALAFTEQRFRAIRWSPLFSAIPPRAKVLNQLAVCLVALARISAPRERGHLLRRAKSLSRRVRSAGSPYTVLLADVLDAGIACSNGESVTGRMVHLAEQARALDMSQYYLTLRYVSAMLHGDTDGVKGGAEQLLHIGVKCPDRWAAVLLPGLAPPPEQKGVNENGLGLGI